MTRGELGQFLQPIFATHAQRMGVLPPGAFIDFQLRRDAKRGVLATNIALMLSAKLRRLETNISARDIADEMSQILREETALAASYEISSENGWINFRMNEATLNGSIERALIERESYGLAPGGSRAGRLNVEFVSADPTGPLTLTHGRIAVFGDALCRLLAWQGADVTREYFLNDIETSSKLRLLGESVAAFYVRSFGQDASLPEGALDDEWVRSVARQIAAQDGNAFLLQPEAERTAAFAHRACEAAVAAQKATLHRLGVYHDVWSSEASLHRDGRLDAVIERLQKSRNIQERDGGLWLQTSAFGDTADRPLRRPSGEYTYLASDIAYHANRIDRDFSQLISIWTADHQQYVQRTHAALQAAGYDAETPQVLTVEAAHLTRDGVLLENEDGEPNLDSVLEEIDAPVLRFLLLLRNRDEESNIDLDLARRDDESNPAYAAQLLPSRLSTLLRAAEAGSVAANERSEAAQQLRQIVAQWPDEVEAATGAKEPQRIAHFLLQMAESTRKIIAESKADSALSPELLGAAKIVATNALTVLGMPANVRF